MSIEHGVSMEHHSTVMVCPEYVCAIEYGDYSGLDDFEESQVFDWLRRQPEHAVFDWGGADNELRFTQDDITKLMADCIECKIWVPMGASAIALRKREDNQAPRSEVQRYTR